MNNKALDLTKLTVQDLFTAKEERRRRLALLPFEQKIAIVKKLQTIPAALRDEKLIFDSFLQACPELANRITEWDTVGSWYENRRLPPPDHPFDKRPDIIAVTNSGKKIGVELKSWVNREQIAAARKEERIRETLLAAIGEQPPNETKHIGLVWLKAKPVRFDAEDMIDFRQQLFRLIDQIDDTWTRYLEEDLQDIRDLSAYPTLAKYLSSIRFFSKRRDFKQRWIRFPSPGGHYSPNEMRETLRRALLAHKNDPRYKDLKAQVGLDEVYLLIHYDFKAFAYNTPFDAPHFGFKEAAEFASDVLKGDGGYFDKVFLFHFLWEKEEAYRIS